MFKPTLAITLAALLASCSAQDDSKPTLGPTPQPGTGTEPQPGLETPSPTVVATIASVQLQEDCPDAVAPSTPSAMSAPADRAAGPAPCTQSRIQISFEADAVGQAGVSLAAVRLLSVDGKLLSNIPSRAPSLWSDNGYTPWDQIVPQGAAIQASYKIAPPDWSVVEATLGTGSFGTSFIIEAEISVAGKTLTVRSNPFTRQQPEAVPT